MLQRKNDRSWREEIERNVAESWRTLEVRAMQDADPINPQRVFWELSSRLPDECILSAKAILKGDVQTLGLLRQTLKEMTAAFRARGK